MAEEPGITLWAGPKVIYVNALFPGVDLEELQIDVAGTRLMFRWFMHSGGFCGRSGRRRTRGIVKKYTHAVELPYRVDAGRVDISKESGLISIILKRDDSAPVPPASGSSDPSRSPGAIA
jgi:HSP20 family molecular chaperone IbpA